MRKQLKAIGLQQGVGAVETVMSLEQGAATLKRARTRADYIFGYITPWANGEGRVQSSVKVVCFFGVDDVTKSGHRGMPMLLEAGVKARRGRLRRAAKTIGRKALKQMRRLETLMSLVPPCALPVPDAEYPYTTNPRHVNERSKR